MTCTWVGCTQEGAKIQLDKAKKQWANLCLVHDEALEKAIDDFVVKGTTGPGPMLAAWVKASGGAKKMAERI